MKIVYIPFLLVLLTACREKSKYRKAADEIAANVTDAKNMNAGKENYTIDVPNGWTTEHRSAYGVDYYFLLPPKTEKDPNTNINVITEYMQNLSLDDYRKKTIESVKKSIPGASILGQGDITADGLKGGWYS